MGVLAALGVIIVSSIVIYFVASRFAISSSRIGDYFNLPRDVKGATFDAIASSMPELFVALFSVIFFRQFEVGIGTIAGSALFNLLVIPGICVFVAPIAFKVSPKVITRDALFYMISVFVLIVLIIYFKTWGLVIAAVLLGTYLWYLKDIINHTKAFDKEHSNKDAKEINLNKEITIFLFAMLIIGVFTYLLTDYSIELAHLLGVSPIIIAFTIIAAATSLPDTIISVVNAKKGDLDDATSNVFGSNVFDILVGIGLPLLIFVLMKGPVMIQFENLEIVLGLLGSTILILHFFADDRTLSKRDGSILLIMYVLFVLYTVFLSVSG